MGAACACRRREAHPVGKAAEKLIRTCLYAYAHACMSVRVCGYVSVHMYGCTHAWLHVYMHVWVFGCMGVCMLA